MTTRRHFLSAAGLIGAAVVSKAAMGAVPEARSRGVCAKAEGCSREEDLTQTLHKCLPTTNIIQSPHSR